MQRILNNITKYSIYLLVFLVPLFWLPFSFEAFEFNKQYLLFFLVSIALFSWLAKMIFVDKEIRFRRSPLDLFVLAFLFAAVLSVIFSVSKDSSLFGFYGRFSNGLIGLLSLGALYFLITNNVALPLKRADDDAEKTLSATNQLSNQRQISVNGLIRTFLGSVFFVVLFSYFSIFGVWIKISQSVSLPQIMQQAFFNPVSGSLESLTMFLAAIVALLAGMVMVNQKKEKQAESGLERLGKAGTYFLLLSALGLLMIINFNPAWLVILLALLLFLFVALWKRIFREEINKLLLPIFLVILSFAFLFISAFGVQEAVLGYYLPQERILDQQTSWLISSRALVENVKAVFLGSGLGAFHYDFAKFKPVELNQTDIWQIRFDRPGSHLAETLATTGALGLFSYLALIGMFLLVSYLFLEQNKKGIFLLPVFLVLLLSQIIFYQNTVLAFAFWLFLALSVVSWQKPLKEKVISFREFPELSLIFSVLLMIFGLMILAGYFFGARFYLADANYRNYFETGDGKKLEEAIKLNPYQSQYRLFLARDYLDKIIIEGQKPMDQIDEANLSNNIYFAITFAREATQLSPNRVATWETLAVIYREIQGVAAGATEWGIKSLEKATSLEPTNPVLHTELGKFYLVLGQIEAAKEKFSRAKELMPEYADASLQMAFIHEYEGRTEEAVRQMEELFSFYPYNVEIIFQLGRFYLNDNQIDEAISQFEWALQLFPNHSNSLYSLGAAYQRKGEKEKAIENFERVLELNPGNEDIIQKLEELREEKIIEEMTEEELTDERSIEEGEEILREEMEEEEMREE